MKKLLLVILLFLLLTANIGHAQFNDSEPMFGEQLNLGHWSTDGLVGYWRFIEAGNLVDESLFGNDGVITGATGVGDGLSFNGASDVVDIGGANFRSQDSQGTIIARIRRDATATGIIYASSDEGTVNHFIDFFSDSSNSGTLTIGQNNGGATDQVRSTTPLLNDVWYTVAVTSDGSVWALYIDGLPESLITVTGSNSGNWFADVAGRDNSRIGVLTRTSSAAWWPGDISYFSIYNRALSASEIQALYINPNRPIQQDPIWLLFSPTIGGFINILDSGIGPSIFGGSVVR